MAPDPSGWPWPLNGVQDWFESLWNQVTDAAYSAVNYIWTYYIWPKIKWLRDQVSSFTAWLWDKVKPLFGPLATWSAVVVKSFWEGLQAFVKDPVGTLSVLAKGVTDTLGAAISQVQTSLNDVWTAMRDSLSFLLKQLSVSLSAGINWLSSEVSKGINNLWTATSAGFSNVSTWISTSVTGLWDSLSGLASDILKGVTEAFSSGFNAFVDWLLKHLGYLSEMIVGAVSFVASKVKDTIMSLFYQFANAVTGAVMPGSPPKEIENAITVMTEAAWKRQIEVIDGAYKSAPTAAGLDTASTTVMAVLMAAAGSGMIAAVAADLAHPLKDIGFKVTMRELIYWSGIPSVTAAIAVLPAAIGILEPLRYFLYERWQPLIAPADDLIRFAVREIFIPAEFERLIVPGPGEDFYTYMHKHGFNDFWANAYWAAHWIRPSIESLTQALYRDIIDAPTWMKEVRLNDYVPYAIPWLQQTIYAPYTRVDIRRMWDLAVVTDDEVYTNYKWLGYDDEHSKKMLLWTKAYAISADVRALYSKGWIDENGAKQMLIGIGIPAERVDTFMKRLVKTEQPERMKEERNLTKADVLRLLKIRLISEDQAKSVLLDMGYDTVEADYIIRLALFHPEIELKELTLSQIISAYHYGVYTKNEAITKLLDAGWSSDAVRTLMEIEEAKLAERKAKEEMPKEKDLAKTDIVALLKSGLITDVNAREMLMALGYSNDEANYIIELTKLKSEMQLKDLTTAQILKAYDYEIYNREQAKLALVESGVNADAAEVILKLEDVKLADAKVERMRERDLSRSDIIDAIKREIIDKDTGYNYLAYMGYSEWEIKVIFALEGVP